MSWVAVAIGGSAVVGAAGSYLSARSAKKSANKLAQQQQPLIDAQAKTATALQPYATGFYDRAQRAYDPAFKYYNSLMSGSRSNMVSALAPEIGGINQGYNNTLQTTRELSPRGGATTAFMSELPFRRADEIQALISGGRRDAAGKMAGLAEVAGNLGGSAAGHVTGAAQGASNALNSQFYNQQYANAQQGMAYQQMTDALLANIHWDQGTKTWGWGARPGGGT